LIKMPANTRNVKSAKRKQEMTWHFPALDHGESEGLNDPLLQYFGGDHSWYVAREVIQNSVDARADYNSPVTVRFTKFALPAKNLPGMKELRDRLKVCLQRAKSEKNERAEKHYKEALETAISEEIAILRASDFNTSGLTGQDGDKDGRWHRLVKAIGENQPAGVGGGSYGIGKGAPFVASKLRTVYYSTKNEAGEYIFQGKTRILSHTWQGKEHRGIGFYGIKGYESVRSVAVIPSDFKRSDQGTDLNIIGYRAENGWMKGLAESVLENFWMAIHAGDLEVFISESDKEIDITKSTLLERLTEFSREKGLPYYRSVIAPTRTEKKQLPVLGVCSLYIKQDDGFPKDIVMMRKPKMAVEKWKFRKTLQDAYAGVFICEDDKGNMLLRGLEPPEHNKWNESLDKENGKKIISEINEWIRGVLQEMAAQEGGDPEDIPELDKFLPFDEDSEKQMQSNKNRKQPSGDIQADESPIEVGAEREEIEDEIEEFVRRPSGMRNLASGGIGAGDNRGDGSGSDGGTGTAGGDKPVIARVNTSSLKFRTIYAGSNNNDSEYCLVVEPLADQEGAINIVAVGDDAAVYGVPILSARDWESDKKGYKIKGSFIEGLQLKKGKSIKIRLTIKSRSRYALGIENYEG
jgi:hypothetical protein